MARAGGGRQASIPPLSASSKLSRGKLMRLPPARLPIPMYRVGPAIVGRPRHTPPPFRRGFLFNHCGVYSIWERETRNDVERVGNSSRHKLFGPIPWFRMALGNPSARSRRTRSRTGKREIRKFRRCYRSGKTGDRHSGPGSIRPFHSLVSRRPEIDPVRLVRLGSAKTPSPRRTEQTWAPSTDTPSK